jgi:hypothetical protein
VRCLAFALLLSSGLAFGQRSDADLQRAFVEAVQQMQAGNLARAEEIFRQMLKVTDSPRVRLELARVLYLQGKYAESKALFQEVSMHSDTPWRVRDNIAHFVRDIEERTGYLKFGVTFVSDNNPRNLATQKEFSIGDLRVTPTEAPKKTHGLRYSARGWLPIAEPLEIGGYLAASYFDYPGQELDRLTVDAGLVRKLTDSGRWRVKPGIEFATFGGQRLYHFPYVGLDAVLSESESYRLTGEVKAGKVFFPDFDYLEARHTSASVSVRKLVSENVTASLSGSVERSSANERPYSYYGWDAGPGVDTFWPGSSFLLGARGTVGSRKYGAQDPLFGERRSDAKLRLEATIGNKQWRWRNSNVSLVASLERNDSNIGFFSYRKTNVSVVVE